MSDLTGFLIARIAEDTSRTVEVAHFSRFAPFDYMKVLADLRAKRELVERYREIIAREDAKYDVWRSWMHACFYLALPYADHPDYREEWKP